MRKKICAGNWKMYKSPTETRDFLRAWGDFKNSVSCQTVIFAPAYNLSVLSEVAATANMQFGSQNVYPAKEGAFTGELSPFVVQSLGAQWALIGHSERRTLFAETDELIAKKVLSALEFQLKPMICVGETLAERQSGQTEQVVERQVTRALSLVKDLNSCPFVIAYEPVWAIGTGQVATPAQAAEVHAHIRSLLASQYGDVVSNETPILYGGSVKPENASELAKQNNIDGFLVGGASLKPADFAMIARSLT